MNNLLPNFSPISLEEAQKASLLDRIESKYLVTESQLPALFNAFLTQGYRVLEIDNTRSLHYTTLYFDTPDFRFYHDHHNGKLNRLKFRTRTYRQNGQSFNEIKRKSNRGKTFKSRIKRGTVTEEFDTIFSDFVDTTLSPQESLELLPQLYVDYKRITLIAPDFSERITLDTNLSCHDEEREKSFGELIIIEVKRERGQHSIAEKILRNERCKKSGFSKYCAGIASLKDGPKKNNLKVKLRLAEKLSGGKG